jgi:hypothetical protein
MALYADFLMRSHLPHVSINTDPDPLIIQPLIGYPITAEIESILQYKGHLFYLLAK